MEKFLEEKNHGKIKKYVNSKKKISKKEYLESTEF
jgi:hypothetical protein